MNIKQGYQNIFYKNIAEEKKNVQVNLNMKNNKIMKTT